MAIINKVMGWSRGEETFEQRLKRTGRVRRVHIWTRWSQCKGLEAERYWEDLGKGEKVMSTGWELLQGQLQSFGHTSALRLLLSRSRGTSALLDPSSLKLTLKQLPPS